MLAVISRVVNPVDAFGEGGWGKHFPDADAFAVSLWGRFNLSFLLKQRNGFQPNRLFTGIEYLDRQCGETKNTVVCYPLEWKYDLRLHVCPSRRTYRLYVCVPCADGPHHGVHVWLCYQVSPVDG